LPAHLFLMCAAIYHKTAFRTVVGLTRRKIRFQKPVL
jgi:hypothetical protein